MNNTLPAALQRHLETGIVPFWRDRALDREFGGYLTNFDERGHHTGTPQKYLNTQCRLLWWFSTLARHNIPGGDWPTLARHGADFVLRYFWDPAFGGFYWKCRQDGSPLDDGKIVYGESFAIYALSEYTLGTGDPRGLDYASRTFDLLQKFCADTRHGGYYEYLNRDWTPETPGFAGGDRKTLDTHMHLMESFTVLYEASHAEIHRRKLLELVNLICARMIDPATGCGLNQFDLAWNSVPALALKRTWNAERFGERPADPTETTSYGHNVELAWLMRRALEVAKVDLTPYRPVLQRLLDHAVIHGLDRDYGGIYRDGLRATGQPIVREKEFWQHAECLVGFLDGWQLFGDDRYRDAFENIWNFVQRHFIVPGIGEWRVLLARDGSPLDSHVGNPWKVCYHTGRAVLESTERLVQLAGSR